MNIHKSQLFRAGGEQKGTRVPWPIATDVHRYVMEFIQLNVDLVSSNSISCRNQLPCQPYMRWRRSFLFANYHGLVPIRHLLTITCDFFSLVHLPCRCRFTLCHFFSMDCSPQGQRNQARLRGLRCDLRKVFHVLQWQAGTAGRLTSGVGPSAKKQMTSLFGKTWWWYAPKWHFLEDIWPDDWTILEIDEIGCPCTCFGYGRNGLVTLLRVLSSMFQARLWLQ